MNGGAVEGTTETPVRFSDHIFFGPERATFCGACGRSRAHEIHRSTSNPAAAGARAATVDDVLRSNEARLKRELAGLARAFAGFRRHGTDLDAGVARCKIDATGDCLRSVRLAREATIRVRTKAVSGASK